MYIVVEKFNKKINDLKKLQFRYDRLRGIEFGIVEILQFFIIVDYSSKLYFKVLLQKQLLKKIYVILNCQQILKYKCFLEDNKDLI